MIALHCTLLVIALFGLVLAIYMSSIFRRAQREETPQCLDDSCPIVMRTPYAQTLGFPNSYLAVPFYGVVLLYAVLQLAGHGAWLFGAVAAASALSVIMSAYLVHALLIKLKTP